MSNPIPIECQTCGATGEVLRVTANLQCRCGSTDLDLWDGVAKTAADDPDEWKDSNWWAENHEDEDDDSASGSRRRREQEKKEAAAHGPGTGWGQKRPDPASNWSDYAGPTPGYNPAITQKEDADDTHTCPVCNGTGHDERASGGGYDETSCRNCHGTGSVVYPTENDTPSLDAHAPSGPPLGAGSHGHYSVKVGGGGGGASDVRVAVPGMQGNKVVTASQGDKIMAMAARIVETNSGLSTTEAFELARRAVAAFPEDGDQ